MPKKEEMYFRDIDANTCHPLEYFIEDAKEEGLKELTLVRAEKDTQTKGFVWCTEHVEVTERKICNKSSCSEYNSTSGRGVCASRGKLYTHAEKVTVSLGDHKIGHAIDWESLRSKGLDTKLKKW